MVNVGRCDDHGHLLVDGTAALQHMQVWNVSADPLFEPDKPGVLFWLILIAATAWILWPVVMLL